MVIKQVFKLERIGASGDGGVKVGMASGAKGEFWTRERNRDFLGFVRRIITISMDLVPGTTGQFILSLNNILITHSMNAYLKLMKMAIWKVSELI